MPLLQRDYWRTGIGAMARGINAARKDRINHVLTAVGAPVLIVRGPHDRISPRRWADTLAAASQHGQAETLGAGAHMLPFTHPDALAARINAFLTPPRRRAALATRPPGLVRRTSQSCSRDLRRMHARVL